jgi:hypothetical protein
MDTYELTIRFDCESESLASCLAHELIMALRPTAGTALATNPREWSLANSRGEVGMNAYAEATTHERDLAYRYVHAYAGR